MWFQGPSRPVSRPQALLGGSARSRAHTAVPKPCPKSFCLSWGFIQERAVDTEVQLGPVGSGPSCKVLGGTAGKAVHACHPLTGRAGGQSWTIPASHSSSWLHVSLEQRFLLHLHSSPVIYLGVRWALLAVPSCGAAGSPGWVWLCTWQRQGLRYKNRLYRGPGPGIGNRSSLQSLPENGGRSQGLLPAGDS